MAELIDRKEIFFEGKQTGNKEYDEGFLDGAMCVLNAIDEMPTIEAKPVVHAHWVEDSDFDFEEEIDLWFHFCSKCGIPLYGDIEKFEYCPYCGAQMDEKVEEK